MNRNIEVRGDYCPQNHYCPAIWACPQGAIKQTGYSAPEIDKNKCTGCGVCINFCPYGVFKR